jgi:hypothetical protein
MKAALYDPDADSWTELPGSHAVSSPIGGATWDGEHLVVVGGDGAAHMVSPTEGIWRDLTPLPHLRADGACNGPVAAETPMEERVVVVDTCDGGTALLTTSAFAPEHADDARRGTHGWVVLPGSVGTVRATVGPYVVGWRSSAGDVVETTASIFTVPFLDSAGLPAVDRVVVGPGVLRLDQGFRVAQVRRGGGPSEGEAATFTELVAPGQGQPAGPRCAVRSRYFGGGGAGAVWAGEYRARAVSLGEDLEIADRAYGEAVRLTQAEATWGFDGDHVVAIWPSRSDTDILEVTCGDATDRLARNVSFTPGTR